MTDRTTGGSDVTAAIEALRTEIGQLRDLFARRLMEDKARNGLYEALQEQARTSQDQLRHRNFESLFREALLAVDRLQIEPVTPDLVDSAVEELLEVFARRSLQPVNDLGPFDPRVHEAVDSVPASMDVPAGTIVAVHRKGYFLGDRLLRPAKVTVTAGSDPLNTGQSSIG